MRVAVLYQISLLYDEWVQNDLGIGFASINQTWPTNRISKLDFLVLTSLSKHLYFTVKKMDNSNEEENSTFSYFSGIENNIYLL